MTKDEALTLALEALEDSEDQLAKPYSTDARRAIAAIKEALAQPEQKWIYGTPLLDAMSKDYVAPERQWVGLTDEQIADATEIYPTTQPDKWHETLTIARNIEAKLKEKNA